MFSGENYFKFILPQDTNNKEMVFLASTYLHFTKLMYLVNCCTNVDVSNWGLNVIFVIKLEDMLFAIC